MLSGIWVPGYDFFVCVCVCIIYLFISSEGPLPPPSAPALCDSEIFHFVHPHGGNFQRFGNTYNLYKCMNGYKGLVKSKHPAWLIFRQPKWLVGTPQILYPNKHHPFALPTTDSRTSVVVGCDQLLLMKVTRLLRHYSATFPARDLARGVMGCLCQQIYLCKLGAPWLWHVLKRH